MTMREIARQCDIPESTLRVYRDEFEAFLPAVGEGKRRRYPEETLERLRLIVALKKAARPSDEIRQELGRRRLPEERARRRNHEERLDTLVALVQASAQELAALRAEVGELRRLLRETRRPVAFDAANPLSETR